MPDLNNGPGNDLNSSRSFASRRFFETDLNNGSSPSHSQPCVRWRIHLFKSPTYGFLAGAISVQGPHA